MDNSYIKIEPNKSKSLDIKELWSYKDLILMFTKRSFITSYAQTILGPIWIGLTPILTALVYIVLFGQIAKLSSDGIPQILFYLAGASLWSYFNNCVKNNSNLFLNNSHLFSKVYFPRLVVSLSYLLTNILKYLIQLVIVFIIAIFYLNKGMINPQWLLFLLLPLLIILVGLLGTGLGLIVSSLTTKYRDLSVLIEFGMSLLMYATPIVYPLSSLSGLLKKVIMYNPLSFIVELYRYILFGQGTISISGLIINIVTIFIILIIGLILFNKTDKTFIDRI